MSIREHQIRSRATVSLSAAAAVPKVTVLVAAWNEVNNIGPFIHSYLELPYPNRELVLCAGGTDDTFQEAAAYVDKTILVLQQYEGEGKQGALRRGFAYATGDIVVLTDADCLMNEGTLMRLVEPILRGESGVSSGHCRPKQSQLTNPFVFYQHALQQRAEPALREQKYLDAALLGRNCAILRTVLEEVGAFDEDVSIGTDSFLAKKVSRHGYTIRFVPESVVETDFPCSIRAYCRQQARWSRNGITHNLRFRLYRRTLTALLLPARGLTMFVIPFFGLRFGRFPLYLWTSFFVYSFLVRVTCVWRLRKSQERIPLSIYWRIIPYLLAEWAAPVLALVQLFVPRARNQW